MKKSKIPQSSLPVPCSLFPVPLPQRQFLTPTYLKQDVPNSPVKAGNKGVVLDHLNPTTTQPEPGYILEVFEDGETLDVVSVPISWVNPLPERKLGKSLT